MTTQELHDVLAPIALHFAGDSVVMPEDEQHMPIHLANSLLLFFLAALKQANAGQSELLLEMYRRVGVVPGWADDLLPPDFAAVFSGLLLPRQ